MVRSLHRLRRRVRRRRLLAMVVVLRPVDLRLLLAENDVVDYVDAVSSHRRWHPVLEWGLIHPSVISEQSDIEISPARRVG
jgi:hypothetical protein